MQQPETILTRIERYLLQRQALAGNIAYTSIHRKADNELGSALDITVVPTLDTPHREPEFSHQPTPTAAASTSSTQDISLMPKASSSPANVLSPSLFGESVQAPEKKQPTAYANADWQSASSLPALREQIHTCQNCKLGATRTNFVFGVGNPNAGLMVIGEAPGADEDAQGEPFVGRGGQLLTKILEAINFKREEVYIANIIKCRPPENRRPESDEVAECEPYLYKQIDLVQPKFILALGLTAVNTLLKSKHTMGTIRGKVLEFRGIPMMTTYHPAALLRNPEWKRAAWEDVQLLRKLYDEALSDK